MIDFEDFARRGGNAQRAVDDLTRPNTPAEIEALFASMSVKELRLFQSALTLDLRHATSDQTRSFCDERLRLIERELRRRREG